LAVLLAALPPLAAAREHALATGHVTVVRDGDAIVVRPVAIWLCRLIA
jgi:hypothetical protein